MQFLWTSVYVKDLDESVAFYSDLLGLRVLRRFVARPGIEIAFMGNGTQNETLVELLADDNNRSVNSSEFVFVGFSVESLDVMLKTVESKHIPIHSGPFETPGSRAFSIKDPNGLTIQFFQQK